MARRPRATLLVVVAVTTELDHLDFAPRCSFGESNPALRCSRPAHYGYTYSCGCAALFCGEHDARLKQARIVNCPRHGGVTRTVRTPLKETS